MILFENDLIINKNTIKVLRKNNKMFYIKYNFSNILWDDLNLITNFCKINYLKNFNNNKTEIVFSNDVLKNNLFEIQNLYFPDSIKSRFKFFINHDNNGDLKTKTNFLGSKKNNFENKIIKNIQSLKNLLSQNNNFQMRIIFKPTIYFYKIDGIEKMGINLNCINLEIKNELSHYRSEIDKNIFTTKIINPNNNNDFNNEKNNKNLFKIKV